MRRERSIFYWRHAALAGGVLLVLGCLPPPIVITFQGTPTPVLLSKVDRVGGQPQEQTPPPVTSFAAGVRSELVTKSTSVTETTSTTGNNTGSTGSSGGGSGATGSGATGSGAGKGYSTGVTAGDNKGKYAAPPRTTQPPPSKVETNGFVYGAGAYYQAGPNLLTYQSLRALYSKDARAKNPNPPNPKDVDIYLQSFRVRSIFFSYTDSETSQSDPEPAGGNQTSTTTTTKETRTVYKVNGARIRADITPKR